MERPHRFAARFALALLALSLPAIPAAAAGVAELGAAVDAPRVGAPLPDQGPIRIGRGTLEPRTAGSVRRLLCGGEPCGLAVGAARFVYRVEDRFSRPTAAINFRRLSGVAAKPEGEALVASLDLSGAVIWGWELAPAAEGEPAAGAWWETAPAPLVATRQAIAVDNPEGAKLAVRSRTRVEATRDGVGVWRAFLTERSFDNDGREREWSSLTKQISDGASLYLATHLGSEANDFEAERDYAYLVYAKGPLVLHALRQELARTQGGAEQGDRYFFALLRTFLKHVEGGWGESRHLVGILDQVTGKSWQPWFERYVYGPETPAVDL